MQIDDQFIHCVGFVGVETVRGFRPDGTCFFLNLYDDEHTFTYAATAGHVIRNFSSDVISIRVQRKSGLAPRIFDTKRDEWIFHHDPNVDICVYTVNWRNWEADGD